MNAASMYDVLTDNRTKFVRVDELCYRAAERFPGVLPSAADLAAEAPRLQKDKHGIEKAQGEFLSAVLRDPVCGTHLCHAMLLPHPGSAAKLAEFESSGNL
ncbi:MAG TPA: hypothetical protein VNU64_04355, partial [Burkholderiales bacterium]|nr:hypothetical protein [Burkholderiales bacterium]